MNEDRVAEKVVILLKNRAGFNKWWLQLDNSTKESIKNRISMVIKEEQTCRNGITNQ